VRLWRRFKAWLVQEETFCTRCGSADPEELGPDGCPMCDLCAHLLAFQIAGNRAIRRARAKVKRR